MSRGEQLCANYFGSDASDIHKLRATIVLVHSPQRRHCCHGSRHRQAVLASTLSFWMFPSLISSAIQIVHSGPRHRTFFTAMSVLCQMTFLVLDTFFICSPFSGECNAMYWNHRKQTLSHFHHALLTSYSTGCSGHRVTAAPKTASPTPLNKIGEASILTSRGCKIGNSDLTPMKKT